MIIEVTEKGSKEFYKEVINVSINYRRLIKQNDRKLTNFFKYYTIMAIVCVVIMASQLAMYFAWGRDAINLACAVAMFVCALISGAFLLSFYKALKGYQDDKGSSTITIDESGISLKKEGTEFKMAWENVAFARCFKESIAFVGKENSKLIISLTEKYSHSVLDYIKDNNIDCKVIK